MRRWLPLAGLLGLLAGPASAETPAFAYPPPGPVTPLDNLVKHSVPGSRFSFTEAQIEDFYTAVDWFPDAHPPMPDPVAHGRAPAPRACGVCHLPNGAGHPESANLAGLPADYLARQTEAFANGERASPRTKVMGEAARAISPAEIKAAAAYFAALPPSNTSRVSEATEVPRSIVNSGGLRLRAPDGGTEPLGARIISLPLTQATVDRDPRSGFVSYVPPGSLARGKALAAGCVTCHGADLRGGELGPPIAGQHPLYVYRQLNDLKIGNRRGGTTAMMGPVVAPLDNEGMIALASYLGSLSPIGPTGKH